MLPGRWPANQTPWRPGRLPAADQRLQRRTHDTEQRLAMFILGDQADRPAEPVGPDKEVAPLALQLHTAALRRVLFNVHQSITVRRAGIANDHGTSR